MQERGKSIKTIFLKITRNFNFRQINISFSLFGLYFCPGLKKNRFNQDGPTIILLVLDHWISVHFVLWSCPTSVRSTIVWKSSIRSVQSSLSNIYLQAFTKMKGTRVTRTMRKRRSRIPIDMQLNTSFIKIIFKKVN